MIRELDLIRMGLLQQIEEGASSDTVPLPTLLRNVMRLASRIESKLALDWIEHELNGYPKGSIVPEYKKIHLIIKANVEDGFRQLLGWTVPPVIIGDKSSRWTDITLHQGIGEIERLVRSNDNKPICFGMGDLSVFLNSHKHLQWNVVSAWGEASSGHVGHILDTVRTRVLKLVLDVGKEFPDVESIKLENPREVDRMTQIVTNNIFGPGTIVGNATNSNVVTNVLQGDHASLKQELEEAGVSSVDISELKAALLDEPKVTGASFGPKVARWIGNMTSKAADGSWKIATGTASALLARVIGKFYGIPT